MLAVSNIPAPSMTSAIHNDTKDSATSEDGPQSQKANIAGANAGDMLEVHSPVKDALVTPPAAPDLTEATTEGTGQREIADAELEKTNSAEIAAKEDPIPNAETEIASNEKEHFPNRALEKEVDGGIQDVAVDSGGVEGALISADGEAENKDSHQKEMKENNEDESNYPSGFALGILTVGLFLATFVVALDNTIIATAIPRITTEFNSLGDVGWYGSSYLLTTTSLQPTFGKIYTYFDVKWTYLFAVFIFEVGSIVCATAPNSIALIVGRAVAGVGASALFSGGMTIIGYSVPLRKRALYIALLSSTFGIASVVGPLLGGVFTDSATLTWRFCFWINLPFGGLALLTTAIFFKKPVREHSNLEFKEKIAKIDILGAFILICAIVCLLLALQWGGVTYAWNNSKVWGCILGFFLLIIIFIALQFRRGDNGTIPPRLMLNRTVASGCAFTAFLSMGLYTHIYFLPFYFQAIKGTSAEGSGIRTIPYLVSVTLSSIVVGGLITGLGPYTPFLWVGSAIFTVGCGLLYTLGVSDGAGRWIGYQLLTGIGAGGSVQIPFIAVQVAVNAKDMPSGNALTIFFNSLGGAFSISIAQNIFSNTLAQELEAVIPPQIEQLVIRGGATRVQQVTPPQYLPVVLQAYDDAVTRAFILPIAVGGIAFLCALCMPWGTVKGKKLSLGA